MANVVGQKGQVVIEKEIRDKLGVKPGWIALQMIKDNHVEIYFVPPEHNRSLMGSLRKYVKEENFPEKDWNDLRDEAWEKHVKERYKSGESID
jgi:AbrB family looped-hinge helix DNA binding protein